MKKNIKYIASALFLLIGFLFLIKKYKTTLHQSSKNDKQEIKKLVKDLLPWEKSFDTVCCDSFSTQSLNPHYQFFCIAFHHNSLYFIPIKKFHNHLKHGTPKSYTSSDFGKITFRFNNSNVIFFDPNQTILYNLSIPPAYRGYKSQLCPFILDQEEDVKTFIHFIKKFHNRNSENLLYNDDSINK